MTFGEAAVAGDDVTAGGNTKSRWGSSYRRMKSFDQSQTEPALMRFFHSEFDDFARVEIESTLPTSRSGKTRAAIQFFHPISVIRRPDLIYHLLAKDLAPVALGYFLP